MSGARQLPSSAIKWRDFILGEDSDIVEQALRMMFDEKTHVNFQFRLKRTWSSADGVESPAWIMAWAFPELHEDGSVKSVMGTMIEISQLKWAESMQKLRVEEALESKRQQEK